MCIRTSDKPRVIKNGELKLWKIIRQDNHIGIWGETQLSSQHLSFVIGENVAIEYDNYRYTTGNLHNNGQFHCFFTRKDARKYYERHKDRIQHWNEPEDRGLTKIKIIKVYADSSDVVKIGQDSPSDIRAISVSKMEIKSLKHQR